MKTLSNAELQDAIRYSTDCVRHGVSKSNEHQLHLEQLVALLDEQRRRASERVELTIEPMTTTLERVDFDARVKAQDGPEWVDHDLSDDMPVSRNTTVEVQFEDGQRHGGCAKDFIWTDIDDETNIARYRVWSSSEEKE